MLGKRKLNAKLGSTINCVDTGKPRRGYFHKEKKSFFFFFFFYHLIPCSSFSSFRQKEMYTQELNGKAVCRTVYRVKRIKEQGWGSTATGLEEQEDRATKTGQKGNLSTSPISLPAQHYGREQPELGTG